MTKKPYNKPIRCTRCGKAVGVAHLIGDCGYTKMEEVVCLPCHDEVIAQHKQALEVVKEEHRSATTLACTRRSFAQRVEKRGRKQAEKILQLEDKIVDLERRISDAHIADLEAKMLEAKKYAHELGVAWDSEKKQHAKLKARIAQIAELSNG
jgi:hypothetical protein